MDIWRAEKNQTAKNQPEKKFLASTYNEFSPDLSPDGSRLIFVSNRTGANQIWKMSAAGGEPVQITRREVSQVIAALPDGTGVLFTRTNDVSIWRVSADGAEERIVPELAAADIFGGNWAATRRGLYFLALDSSKSLKIKYYDFDGGKVVNAVEHSLTENQYGGITASADGSVFFYARQDRNTSSIMFTELGK